MKLYIVLLVTLCQAMAAKLLPTIQAEDNRNGSRTLNLIRCLTSQASDYCPDKNVQFYLFTRRNPVVGQLLTVTTGNITMSHFNASHPTKIVIHGYNSDMNSLRLGAVREEYLILGEHNVVCVDWKDLGRGPEFCYPQAARTTPHVGRCVAHMIRRLREVTAAHDFHVIGFSLGAQIAGFAANKLRPFVLSRITALDPALPLFAMRDTHGKLDAGDASFVDVVHTNAFFKGQGEQTGHVDFYVNGGSSQSGCTLHSPDFLGCSHSRAILYFAESINSDAGFWGWDCPDVIALFFGRCPAAHPTLLMGAHTPISTRGVVIVPTAQEVPFALGQWVTPGMLKAPSALTWMASGMLKAPSAYTWMASGMLKAPPGYTGIASSMLKAPSAYTWMAPARIKIPAMSAWGALNFQGGTQERHEEWGDLDDSLEIGDLDAVEDEFGGGEDESQDRFVQLIY